MGHILIIDDDDEFRGMLVECLSNEGYDIMAAANGKEGINLYRREPADLVITDVLMPEKDGVETIVELGKEFPDLKIFVVSGGGRGGSAEEYLHSTGIMCNVIKTFSKPFIMEEMLEAIKSAIKP